MHRVCRTFPFAPTREGVPIVCTVEVTLAARRRPEPAVADPGSASDSMFSPKLRDVIAELVAQRLNGYQLTAEHELTMAEDLAEMVYINASRITREARRQTNWKIHVEAARVVVPGVGWAESSWAPLEP